MALKKVIRQNNTTAVIQTGSGSKGIVGNLPAPGVMDGILPAPEAPTKVVNPHAIDADKWFEASEESYQQFENFKASAQGVEIDKTAYAAAMFWHQEKYGKDYKSLTREDMINFLTENPNRDDWVVKPVRDPFVLPEITLTAEEQKVKDTIQPLIDAYYKAGEGLEGVALKNYTSGDYDNDGFEKLVVDCVHATAGLKNVQNCVVNQDYFRPTLGDGDLDAMRMDQHVWVDGKLAGLIETRAWIDKPFYQLKRNVVQTFEQLPHTKRHMTDKTKFLFLGLNIDITNRLIKTQDDVYTPKHELECVPLSKGRRSGPGNYFDNGLNDEGVKHLARFLNGLFT